MKHQALKLYDFNVWANGKFFQRLKELPREIYDQDIPSVFPSIAETLIHMYTVDTIWLGVIREDDMINIQTSIAQSQEEAKGKGLEEMELLFRELAEAYQTFLNSVSNLDRAISPDHPQFGRLDTRLSELVQHVVNHGTYHRGSLTAMIRQLGHQSVPTDYVFYLYEINAGT